jgi:hypothetical protein
VYGTSCNVFFWEICGWLSSSPVRWLADDESRNAAWLAGQGHAVTAMDRSGVGLAKARTA